jgi:hypothetical protein
MYEIVINNGACAEAIIMQRNCSLAKQIKINEKDNE